MKRRFFAPLVLVVFFIGLSGYAHARGSYLDTFNTKYGTAGTRLNSCALCHPNGNPPNTNPYGAAFEGASGFPGDAAFTAIEGADSDVDDFTNIAEINALTFPGDPADHPVAADTTPPTVTAFAIPATSDSLTVPINSFTATDNVGVTGYLVTETPDTPAPSAPFTGSPPASFTFTTEGAKTLYAWAKDAADNVSASLSAFVTITLPPGNDTMLVPTNVQVFNLLPTAEPFLSVDPAQARPIAFGAYAEGANVVGLEVGLLPFSGPVDVYLALLAPALSPELLLFTEAGGLLIPISQGLVPWRANLQPGLLNVTLVPEVPTSTLPPGTYTLFLAVTPAGGSFDAFYLWQSAFTVGVPIVTSLSGTQVVPAVTTTGSGVANLGVNLVTNTIAGTLSFSGLSSVATGASIHQGAVGTNGPTILDLEGGAGALSGVFTVPFTVPQGAVLTADQLLALSADNLYIVVKSGANLDGEIRGQIILLP